MPAITSLYFLGFCPVYSRQISSLGQEFPAVPGTQLMLKQCFCFVLFLIGLTRLDLIWWVLSVYLFLGSLVKTKKTCSFHVKESQTPIITINMRLNSLLWDLLGFLHSVITTLCTKCYSYPHFTEEETKAAKFLRRNCYYGHTAGKLRAGTQTRQAGTRASVQMIGSHWMGQ